VVQVEDRIEQLAAHVALLEKTLGVLGINIQQPDVLLQELRVLALERAELSEEDIVQAIADRAAARADKNYARADELREEFAKKGINFQDSPQGTTWRPATQEFD
jgi:cysteinyl-tRNA synthetase